MGHCNVNLAPGGMTPVVVMACRLSCAENARAWRSRCVGDATSPPGIMALSEPADACEVAWVKAR